MEHSLCGGVLCDIGYYNFAKIKFLEETMQPYYWYIYENFPLKKGEEVLAPYGKNNCLKNAIVLETKENVSSQVAPCPINKAKKIDCIVIK